MSHNLRKVQVFRSKLEGKTPTFGGVWKTVDDGIGLFHQFGVCYEESETGFGNYTTAIIEMPDGTIRQTSISMIRFIEPLLAEDAAK